MSGSGSSINRRQRRGSAPSRRAWAGSRRYPRWLGEAPANALHGLLRPFRAGANPSDRAVNRRFRITPLTWGRTSATRYAVVRPGSSVVREMVGYAARPPRPSVSAEGQPGFARPSFRSQPGRRRQKPAGSVMHRTHGSGDKKGTSFSRLSGRSWVIRGPTRTGWCISRNSTDALGKQKPGGFLVVKVLTRVRIKNCISVVFAIEENSGMRRGDLA
jgi:hypothetical protein